MTQLLGDFLSTKQLDNVISRVTMLPESGCLSAFMPAHSPLLND